MTAYECAQNLLEQYATRDPFELAESLGIFVRFKNLGNLHGLYLFADDRAFILINENLCPEQQRMICAHELGHDRLHRELTGAVFSETMLFDRSGKPEIEANTFAAELLIDDREILSDEEQQDLYTLAGMLGVYPEFLMFKLRSMNARGYRIPLPDECSNSFWK